MSIFDAMDWMLTHQLSSKNLSIGEKLAMTEEFQKEVALENEKKRLEGNKLGADVTNNKSVTLQLECERSNDRKDTWTDLQTAKMSGVGTGTVARYDAIMKTDDEVLLDLLESNIRRRGEIGGSAKKVGKRIKELERLYGIQNGSTSFQGNQYEVVTNKSEAPKKTQEQLAAQMGISVDTLQNYKMLAEMIPELEDLVDTGILAPNSSTLIGKNHKEVLRAIKNISKEISTAQFCALFKLSSYKASNGTDKTLRHNNRREFYEFLFIETCFIISIIALFNSSCFASNSAGVD